MTIFVVPYKVGSESCGILTSALKERINVFKIKRDAVRNKKFGSKSVILNWGCNSLDFEVGNGRILNKPDNVAVSSNKLMTFMALQRAGVSVPRFSVEYNEVDYPAISRAYLRSSKGNGIFDSFLPGYRLYVERVWADQEFRVHVFNGWIIDVVQKLLRRGLSESFVRNHDNGYVFARCDIDIPDSVREQALGAVQTLGLDFGAVDVLYNTVEEAATVLEVNTAPGITGTTLQNYKSAILDFHNEMTNGSQ